MIAFHVAFVALLVGTEAFFTVLSVLNVRHGERTVETERDWIEEVLGVEDVEAVTDYHRATTGFSLLEAWVGLGALLFVLYSGLFRRAVLAVGGLGLGSLPEGVVFLVGGLVVLQVASWPFDLFDTFVIEEIFEFNEQSPRLWARDKLVGLAVLVAIAAPLTAGLLWFVDLLGPWWWVAFWGVFVAFSVAMLVIYPRVIAPLFYDFEPLDTGELREAVEDVFERAGFSCEQVYEMDASSRSGHSNAYFIGFGRTKRVVLFDTLIEGMERPEIQAVLAHELAHWKKSHVWRRLAASFVQIGIVFAVLGVLVTPGFLVDTTWLYGMFGLPTDPVPVHAGLVLAGLWVFPVNRLVSPLENRISLKHEREADRFATEVVDGEYLADALATLTADNLANPFPHPWYAAFHYTHPPVPERIRYIREMAGEDPDPGSDPGAGGGSTEPDADPDAPGSSGDPDPA